MEKERGRIDTPTNVEKLVHYEKLKARDKEQKEQIKKLHSIWRWAEANIPEMDCRADEDCDHCFGLRILAEIDGVTVDEYKQEQKSSRG